MSKDGRLGQPCIYGRDLNPHNTAINAGGSSGGEGALISFRRSLLGVGTDAAGLVISTVPRSQLTIRRIGQDPSPVLRDIRFQTQHRPNSIRRTSPQRATTPRTDPRRRRTASKRLRLPGILLQNRPRRRADSLRQHCPPCPF